MKRIIQLDGTWEFVGAESFIDSQWIPNNNFVTGMTWVFTPMMIYSQIEHGVITEQSKYQSTLIYCHSENLLMIDTSADNDDEISTDNYKIEVISPNKISISLLTESYSPHDFRYILSREHHSNPAS